MSNPMCIEKVTISKTHYCPKETHNRWNNEIDPILKIETGDTVVFEFSDVSDFQINPDATVDALKSLDFRIMHPVMGPIYIEGAEPGDILEIEILDLQTRGWGWTGIIPDECLLSGEFNEYYLRVFDLSNGDYIPFTDHIQVPIEPFLGIMGVAPLKKGEYPMISPTICGGNLDIRNLTKGAKLFLPVQVSGALFSAGDGHAAQGDGEVAITGVESPLYGTLRFKVYKNKKILGPHLLTPAGSLRPKTDEKGYYATTGIGSDIKECAKDAIRNMIAYLVEQHSLSKEDAYILCSITVDLKISQIVNPNYTVTAYLPLSIFKS